MARVERHISQGQIPVQQAQLIDPRSFPADTSSAEALKVGADVANVFAELAIRQREAQDSQAATAASKSRTLANLKMEQFKLDHPDPNDWATGWAKIQAESVASYSAMPMTDKMRDKLSVERQAHDEQGRIRVQIASTQQDISNDILEAETNLIDLMGNGADPKDIEDAESILEDAQLRDTTPEIAAIRIAETIKEGQDARAEFAIESIKPDIVDAIGEKNDSADGYRVLDIATAQLAKDGVLTKPEAAEANKKLGDWIDNYVAGRIKSAKEADKLTTIQSYQELSKPIINGELTYEDIDNSDLRETRRTGEQTSDADKWRKYIKGSYKDAPTKSTPEGHTVSFAAVYDVATLQLSPKEGYDVLLEARFVDQSITNDQFEWAVERIENPYPRHVFEDLNATLKTNLEDFNRTFTSDKELNKKVNEALISWADDLIKQGKTPTKKEMFAMSSAFRVGGAAPYDIGGVIIRGGRKWEIVGFDIDGEPLVEELP